MPLQPIDQPAFESWVRATYDLPADVVDLRTGENDGSACVWVQYQVPGQPHLSCDALPAPYPTMESLRAAFPWQPDEGQLTLAIM